MSEYKSEPAHINHPIDLVYLKLSNPQGLSSMIDKLPPEAQEKVKEMTFTPDSITFKAAGSEILLKISEREEPSRIVYEAVSSPLPFKVTINLKKIEEQLTEGVASIEVNIPVFLKPMVQGPLKQATQRFKELLTVIPYDQI